MTRAQDPQPPSPPEAIPAQQLEAVNAAQGRLHGIWDAHRPALFRHCHGLCGNALDAEDLVQESFARALRRLGERHSGVENLRSYLFRIATHVWFDELRRHRPELLPDLPEEPAPEPALDPLELGETYAELLRVVDPRSRAAVLLCDVFDFDGKEAASMIGISHANLRVLLHRARTQLAKAKPPRSEERAKGGVKASPLLERFTKAFRERDVKALLELNTAVTEHDILGIYGGLGDDVAKGIYVHTFEDETLKDATVVQYRGEPLVALWYEADGKRVLRDLLRVTLTQKSLARVRYYYFCPEVLETVGRELGVPVRTQGYRYGKK